jgi:hypothetical protein
MTPYRKTAPKKTYRKKASTAKVSTAVKKYVKQVTAKSRPEMKRIMDSTTLDETAINTLTVPYIFREFSCVQGTQVQGRLGNELYIQGLHLKGILHNNSNTTIFVRRLILQLTDGTPTGAFTEIFTSGTGVPTDLVTTTGLNAMYHSINKSKFKVYDDTVMKLAPLTSVDGNQTKMFNKFQKFGGAKITYEGNTSGEQNQNKRFLVLWIFADANDDTTAATNVVEVSSNITWYYTDP